MTPDQRFVADKPFGSRLLTATVHQPALLPVLEERLKSRLFLLNQIDLPEIHVAGVTVFSHGGPHPPLKFSGTLTFLSERSATNDSALRALDTSHGLTLWELGVTERTTDVLSVLKRAGLNAWKNQFHLERVTMDQIYESPRPAWFTDRRLARDPLLYSWSSAVDRRERYFRSVGDSIHSQLKSAGETVRQIHSEGDPLRAEKLGDVYSLSWFSESLPVGAQRESLSYLVNKFGWSNWILQLRANRGAQPNEASIELSDAACPERWVGEENGLKFEFRRDSGLSTGLFLDQRRNRAWVQSKASGLRVLNLFCYTGGFSVAAAAGGATKIVSVDLSRTFLEWAKQNFALNQLPVEPHEFRSIDSREYLSWAKKKGLKFDLIICDPPSFGRSERGVFKFERDYAALARDCVDCLETSGTLLFSTNFEGWTQDQFHSRMKELGLNVQPTPLPDWDFELSPSERNMKSCFLSKLSTRNR